MKYHVEFDVNVPDTASTAEARDWIRFMTGYSGELDMKNPLKKASFDPAYGSLKIQSREVREVRRAVMLTAWQYRKREGLTMTEAMKKAWAGCKTAMSRPEKKSNIIYFEDYLSKGGNYGSAENL